METLTIQMISVTELKPSYVKCKEIDDVNKNVYFCKIIDNKDNRVFYQTKFLNRDGTFEGYGENFETEDGRYRINAWSRLPAG